MDVSSEYIKLCAKAEEIQKLKPSGADEHDYFYCKVHGFGCDLGNATWLPRQDQLQAMMFQYWNFTERLIHEFSRWIDSTKIASYTNPSMEQLWLAYVMSEKYGKIWNGEGWIKEDSYPLGITIVDSEGEHFRFKVVDNKKGGG